MNTIRILIGLIYLNEVTLQSNLIIIACNYKSSLIILPLLQKFQNLHILIHRKNEHRLVNYIVLYQFYDLHQNNKHKSL